MEERCVVSQTVVDLQIKYPLPRRHLKIDFLYLAHLRCLCTHLSLVAMELDALCCPIPVTTRGGGGGGTSNKRRDGSLLA